MNRHFSNWYDIQIFGEFDPPKKNFFAGFPADRVGTMFKKSGSRLGVGSITFMVELYG